MLYDVGGGGEKSSWELVPFTYILQLFGADLYNMGRGTQCKVLQECCNLRGERGINNMPISFSYCTICPFLATSVRRLKILH